jgi:hypothetical protein
MITTSDLEAVLTIIEAPEAAALRPNRSSRQESTGDEPIYLFAESDPSELLQLSDRLRGAGSDSASGFEVV